MENEGISQEIRPSRKGCNNKVRNSIGVYDIYKKIRKNHWYNIGRPVTEKEFYAIIRGVNRRLADEIAKGVTVELPERMGSLELSKSEAGVSLVDGKLKNTYPVDWAETLKLWSEDPEARQKKALIRNENKWVYKVKYNVFRAIYENKSFYRFALNTFIKKALSKNIKQGKVDALW